MSPYKELKITNSIPADLPFIFQLFDSAIEYQRKNGYQLWPRFSEQLIETEIKENRHWKIMEGETISCIFSVMYNDPVIWGEKDKDPAVYLHRITINPSYKGRNMMSLIKSWAIEHAREKGKKYLRMDTWGRNENLRNYYIRSGFSYIGQQYLKETEGLPSHYGGNELSLFEIEV
jgi:GNAT superfamily N-acetyltransferase